LGAMAGSGEGGEGGARWPLPPKMATPGEAEGGDFASPGAKMAKVATPGHDTPDSIERLGAQPWE
jgi:hypothetical protein